MGRTVWLGIAWMAVATSTWARTPHRPYVVDSLPGDGQTEVDPALKTLTVTFSREMSTRTDGWTGRAPTYPAVAGRSYWDQERLRCSLPVRLEPGRCYVVGVNEGSELGFRSRGGSTALPYAIVFATRGFDTGATPLPFAWVQTTVPACGASGVPPGRTTLAVRLSRPVVGGVGPWQRYGSVVPLVLTHPRYSDNRRGVRMDLMLGGARAYAMEIGARCHPGLMTPDRRPLLPYWLAFRTAERDAGVVFDRPVVHRTDPPMGDETVDPKRSALTLEFSMPLQKGSYRVDRGPGTLPPIVVPPTLLPDRRRCTLQVRLTPGAVYTLGINVRTPKTFYSVSGRPAVPFVWAFATKRLPTRNPTIPYPRVVGVSPSHRADGVPSATKQVRVVFSEPMGRGYSVVNQGGPCPSPVGQPVWSPDRRTITWAVHLRRRTHYRFSLNSRWYRHFRSERGIPCRPTAIEFKTGG